MRFSRFPRKIFLGWVAPGIYRRVVLGAGGCLLVSQVLSAIAQDEPRRISVLRDTESEVALAILADPIRKAAQLPQLRLWVVQDRNIAAFTFGEPDIFVSWRLIVETRSVKELLGVIAHEAAHIAANHQPKLREEEDSLRRIQIASMVLAAPLALATNSEAVAAGGISLASDATHAGLIGFVREKEGEADLLAAKYLNEANLDATGMLTFLDRLDPFASSAGERPGGGYFSTHPSSPERIEALRKRIQGYPVVDIDPVFEYVWQRLRVKLLAIFETPHRVTRELGISEDLRGNAQADSANRSLVLRYGQAVYALREGYLAEAREAAKILVEEDPLDPFFIELYGDSLRQSGQLVEAAQAYVRAAEILPNAVLLHLAAGETLVASGDVSDRTLDHLRNAMEKENTLRRTWRAKGKLHNLRGERALELHALAEIAAQEGDVGRARAFLSEVLVGLNPNLPEYDLAKDLEGKLDGEGA